MNRLVLMMALLTVALSGCKQQRACSQMKSLCGIEADSCKQLRDSVLEKLGAEGLDKLDACLLESKSCAEVTGCTTGAAIKGLVEGAKDFADGLGKALQKP